MADFPATLYVYDLSNGLAQQMGMMLTGKQIDGIWHTSLVAHDIEIFYGGQGGISIVAPGTSHHGQPLKTHPLGRISQSKSELLDVVKDLSSRYTAESYHLLDFNCNTFTNELIGKLNGGSIPKYIIDLPSDVLSTPFGQQMRPMIDNMFRGTRKSTSGVNPVGQYILENVVAEERGKTQVQVQVPSGTSPLSIKLSEKVVFDAVPNLDKLWAKLEPTMKASSVSPEDRATLEQMVTSVDDQEHLADWAAASKRVIENVPAQDIFPLFDIWRVILLRDSGSGSGKRAKLNSGKASDVLSQFVSFLLSKLTDEDILSHKNTLLTLTRTLANIANDSYIEKKGATLSCMAKVAITALQFSSEDATSSLNVHHAGAALTYNILRSSNVQELSEHVIEWLCALINCLTRVLESTNVVSQYIQPLVQLSIESIYLIVDGHKQDSEVIDILDALDGLEVLQNASNVFKRDSEAVNAIVRMVKA